MILLQEQAVNNEEKSYKDNDQSCKKKRKLQAKNVKTYSTTWYSVPEQISKTQNYLMVLCLSCHKCYNLAEYMK